MENPQNIDAMLKEDKQIQKELLAASDKVRQRHPWLVKHQNAIGMTIMLVSLAGVALNAWLYIADIMPAWAVIILTALWTSLLHELEHDLIHSMYFRKNRFWLNVMMLGVYIARPMTQNPWIRKHLHFRHHKLSGTRSDLEERAITNGEKWGIRRLLMTGDLIIGFYLRIRAHIMEPRRLYKEGEISKEDLHNMHLIAVFSYLPYGIFCYMVWHIFLVVAISTYVAGLFGASIAWPEWLLAQQVWAMPLLVTLIVPNLLRMFCLHFISSNMHYYGDVVKGVVQQQCQVLNKWYLAPFQLFCFNFGSTHAIHHFVVRDTFYIRQLAAKESHEVLREHGIRFNDMGTFSRANRFGKVESERPVDSVMGAAKPA